MHVLITGGAGFMGSHMVRYLLRRANNVQIVNLDKLTYAGNRENLKEVEQDPRYTFVQGDIADEETVEGVVKSGVDTIINYAAETHVDRSIMDPKAFLMTDIIGSYVLLEAAKRHGVKKFIQISTDEVFGSIEKGEASEESPFEPNSPYSASKAGGDHLCRSYWRTYGVPVIVTHACNFFGPNQFPEKIIPLFITDLLEGKNVPLYGDGSNEREWIYTDDHCRAIDTIMHQGVAGEVYNIGTGWRMSNIQLVRMILELMDQDDAMIAYVKDRPGHDRRYALNSGKLRLLGWEPTSTLRERLQETIAWYRTNTSWWQKIKSREYRQYYEQQYGAM